ncbi:hypothetical protein BUALT_Bualt15G0069700 [Buddleja alternifolia]|uniref:Peptidase C14 caspase domain-containing protein n=1 Tax=Buddleja alternifolia TaxID=168488 RepID=A0AAV6WDJ2_9LAMI|nr:hypothetical protein BUALT_Bualt15G0069700 [Buddleja alternifolia]
MASKTMRCSYCRTQIVVPPYAHAIQCAACQTIIRFQPNNQTHNSFSQRFKNMARPSPPVVPVSVHGRKRAVLCGISYYGQRYKLDGTVNDVKSMRYFLTQRLGFPSDSILILTEEESDPRLIPTGNNIRKALKWLVQGCQSGDSLVFHYSGHGSQQLDFNRDEVDGYDEILWPVDYQTEGTILDDEINATIVRPLPRGATLHAIIDACHSGTILDLPFVCRINREGYYNWEDHRLPYTAYKGTNGGYAISISACNDNQSSGVTTVGRYILVLIFHTFLLIDGLLSIPVSIRMAELGNPNLSTKSALMITTSLMLPSYYTPDRRPGVNGNVNLMPRPGSNRPYRPSPVNGGAYQVQPQPYPPPAYGHKRAVLCGITYKGSPQSLNGSINDVVIMRALLVERFGFPSSAILMLTGIDSTVPEQRNYMHVRLHNFFMSTSPYMKGVNLLS